MSGLAGVQSLFDGDDRLVPGVLRGYRTWAGLSFDGRLMSTGMAHQWAAVPFGGRSERALCLRAPSLMPAHPEPAPGRSCPCGLYGWYVPDDTRIVTGPLLGVVQATGRVVLGSHGFRAERLEVLGVTSTLGDRQLLRDLRRLGFPVFDSPEALVGAFPPDDVSGLVDHVCDVRCTDASAVAVFAAQLQAAMRQAAAVVVAQSSNHVHHLHVALQALAAAADEPDTRPPWRRALDAVRSRAARALGARP